MELGEHSVVLLLRVEPVAHVWWLLLLCVHYRRQEGNFTFGDVLDVYDWVGKWHFSELFSLFMMIRRLLFAHCLAMMQWTYRCWATWQKRVGKWCFLRTSSST